MIESLSFRSISCVLRSSRLGAAALALCAAGPLAGAQSQTWIQQFGSIGHDSPHAAASDAAGGVFVVGHFDSQNIVILRYDAAGDLRWFRRVGAGQSAVAARAASDGAGGVYAAGSTTGSLGAPNAGWEDVWLTRYDGAGNELWMRQFGTPSWDAGKGLADDGAGGVFVAGTTRGDLFGPLAGGQDCFLARYDGDGNALWTRQFGSSWWDYLEAAVSDGAGGVLITGGTNGDLGGSPAGSVDVWIARYDGAGNQLWIHQFGSAENDRAYTITTDGAGGCFVAGLTLGLLGGSTTGTVDSWVARYDLAGNQLWLEQFGTNEVTITRSAAPDGSGGVYLGGSFSGDMPGAGSSPWADAFLTHFDSAGNRTWTEAVGSSFYDWAWALSADGSGGFFVAGRTMGDLAAPLTGVADFWLAHYEGPCSASTYCIASGTSIPGCQAAIGASGTPRLSNPGGFVISSGDVPGQSVGLCLFGNTGPRNTPFGSLGGQICVQPPVYRSAVRSGGGTLGACDGEIAFTLSDLIAGSPIVLAGERIHAQIWARDNANPDGFLLSDGLTFTVCP